MAFAEEPEGTLTARTAGAKAPQSTGTFRRG